MANRQREHIVLTTRSLLERAPAGSSVTVHQVTAAARVSRATVYRYFPDKASLIRAALGPADKSRAPVEPRVRIIEAALDVFGERGIHGATMAEIAERADLSISGLHWHFKNKDELVSAIAQHIPLLTTLAAETALAEDGDADLETQLTRIANTMLELIERRRGLVRFVMFEAPIYPDVARLASTYTIGRFLPMLATLFDRHARLGRLREGSPAVRAQAFISMIAQLALLRPAFDQLLAPDDRTTVREYIQIILRGVQADPTDPISRPRT